MTETQAPVVHQQVVVHAPIERAFAVFTVVTRTLVNGSIAHARQTSRPFRLGRSRSTITTLGRSRLMLCNAALVV